jgi:hypothetical protein
LLAAFEELDWRRIDVTAIVGCSGLATIYESQQREYREWLRSQEYDIVSVDCRGGLGRVVPELGRLFNWESQFGYSLAPENCNLDALRDGFDFQIAPGGGVVFELVRADVAWREDSQWVLGLLAIAQEHSRAQLARGRRFFTLLVIPEGSAIEGATVQPITIPVAFRGDRLPDM